MWLHGSNNLTYTMTGYCHVMMSWHCSQLLKRCCLMPYLVMRLIWTTHEECALLLCMIEKDTAATKVVSACRSRLASINASTIRMSPLIDECGTGANAHAYSLSSSYQSQPCKENLAQSHCKLSCCKWDGSFYLTAYVLRSSDKHDAEMSASNRKNRPPIRTSKTTS